MNNRPTPTERLTLFAHNENAPVEWVISDEPIGYQAALDAMDVRVDRIARGTAKECVWLLEHPPLYTAGTSAQPSDLLSPDTFPVYQTGRGGQYTYHGPGQRVAYVMLDLNRRRKDVRLFVSALEQWLIDTLAQFNISGERRHDRVGVWVTRPERPRGADGALAEDKIAALGIRLRKWVSFHGISINIAPDLEHFNGIVACGVKQHGVTSFEDLGVLLAMSEVDSALKIAFETTFGAVLQSQSTRLTSV